jgi:hypothetical protein
LEKDQPDGTWRIRKDYDPSQGGSNMGTYTRSRLGVSLFAIAGVLLCAAAGGQEQTHGVGTFKSCVDPKKTCTTSNEECAPGSCCTATSRENKTECSLRIQNGDTFGDTIRIHEAFDLVNPGPGQVRVPASGNLPIVAVSGTTTCTVGGSLPCDFSPDATVTFFSNEYVVQATDPNPLVDQATWFVQDLCDAPGTTGCSSIIGPIAFFDATDLISGCERGSCPHGPKPTKTPRVTRTPRPTRTPKP